MSSLALGKSIFVLAAACAVALVGACGGGSTSTPAPGPNPDDPAYPFPPLQIEIEPERAAVRGLITGKTYYLDVENGSDGGEADGSSAEPWKTLAKVQSVLQPGDGVMLRTGNYGELHDEAGGRSAYVVFMNDEGHRPVFSRIEIKPPSKTASFLLFYGIRVAADWVEPGGDPLDPNSTQSTYTHTAFPVEIENATDVRIYVSDIAGTSKYLTLYGVSIVGSERVTIAACEIHAVQRAIGYRDSQRLLLFYNHLHELAGTAIYCSGANNRYVQIEGNHIHDSNYDFDDPYCPRAEGANYHGSAISLRGGSLLLRNNVIHDGFNSAGIFTYDDPGSADSFDDIVIENNLLFDIRNMYAVRFYKLGSHVVIRNNTAVGKYRYPDGGSPTPSEGPMRYESALAVHSVAAGADGSTLTVSNNVFVGAVTLGDWWGVAREERNIFYSAGEPNAVNPASLVVVDDRPADHTTFFENGFFAGPVIFTWDRLAPETRGHGQLLDFSLAAQSPAAGFGSPALQPADALGPIVDGFVRNTGGARDEGHHDAGCY